MTTKGQVKYSFPAWKGYVFGQEISDDITSVTVNWHDDRSPNTAEIVLASEDDRYIATETDIKALYSDIDVEALAHSVREKPKPQTAGAGPQLTAFGEEDIRTFINKRASGAISDTTKRRVLLAKYDKRVKAQAQPGMEDSLKVALKEITSRAAQSAERGRTSIQKFAALSGDFLRFPLQVGQSIFHTGDPVRIFWRDPFHPLSWFFSMTGTISDWREDVRADGHRSVVLTVEDPLRVLRFARLAHNPNIFDIKALFDPSRDQLIRNFQREIFVDYTVPELFKTLMYGSKDAGVAPEGVLARGIKAPKPLDQFRYGVEGAPTPYSPPDRGAGAFNPTPKKGIRIFQFGPTESQSAPKVNKVESHDIETIESLEAWQDIVDHTLPSRVEDFEDLCLPEYWMTVESELRGAAVDGIIDPYVAMDMIGRNPQWFPVDYGRLLMLLPASLGPGSNRDIMLRDLVNGIGTETEFTSRLSILYNIVERLEFHLYTTPRGDVVVEMPLFSYDPEDFGKYESRYHFPLDDTIDFSSQFSDEDIKTQFHVHWNLVSNMPSLGNSQLVGSAPAEMTLFALVPQFGLRTERLDPTGYIDSPEAAKYYANIKLTKSNADAWMSQVNTLMHIGVGPNRPCYFEARDFIATTRKTTNAIVWGSNGSVRQSLTLNYRRGWSGLIDADSKRIYEPYGGYASQPYNYKLLFRQLEEKVKQSTKAIEHEHKHAKHTSRISEEEIRRNEAVVTGYVEQIVERLKETASAAGKPLSPGLKAQAIMGSFTRTVEKNAEVGGSANSYHLDGLAVDLPNSRLSQFNLSQQDVVNAITSLRQEGAIQGEIEWVGSDPQGHADHVHFEVPSLRKRRSAKKGERL